MKYVFVLAAVLTLGYATGSSAIIRQDRPAATPDAPSPEARALASRIRTAVAAVRSNALTSGLAGAPFELAVSGEVESLIVASGAAPDVVLAALQLAMAEEKCSLTGDLADRTPGCQALADIAAAVASAIGGPAALGGTGTVPTAVGGPPPRGATGSDYAS
jgi:hypothetical protein